MGKLGGLIEILTGAAIAAVAFAADYVSLPVPHFSNEQTRIVKVDIDSDGKQDILTANSKGLFFYKGAEQGLDYPREEIARRFAADRLCIAEGDFDGDGRKDIAISSIKGLEVLLNKADPGEVEAGKEKRFQSVYNQAVHLRRYTFDDTDELAIDDVNGDNRPDILFMNSSGLYKIEQTGLPSDMFTLPKKIADVQRLCNEYQLPIRLYTMDSAKGILTATSKGVFFIDYEGQTKLVAPVHRNWDSFLDTGKVDAVLHHDALDVPALTDIAGTIYAATGEGIFSIEPGKIYKVSYIRRGGEDDRMALLGSSQEGNPVLYTASVYDGLWKTTLENGLAKEHKFLGRVKCMEGDRINIALLEDKVVLCSSLEMKLFDR